MRRILGVLLHRERVAFVDLSQCEPRARLTEAHEIGHQIIPWHQAAFQLDDEERLLGNTCDQLETEAYLAGRPPDFPGPALYAGPRWTTRSPSVPRWQATRTAEVAARDFKISDLRGDRRDFAAEAFYKQHNVLIKVAEKKAARFGRRIRVAAS